MYVTNGHLIAFSSQLYTLTAIYFPTATIYFNAYRPSFTIVGLGEGDGWGPPTDVGVTAETEYQDSSAPRPPPPAPAASPRTVASPQVPQ